MSDRNFYITTPIYYPSDKLHIGHSYTTVAADVMARYKKLRGYDVKFLTGTDEHGQKIERVAKERGVEPKQYVDGVVEWIKSLWKLMDIEYDIFIRTTDTIHEDAVKKIFRKLYDIGDIYKSNYSGLYCTPCETFFTERQLLDGKCPDCGRDVESVQEESYFFKLSKYQDRLIEYIESHPDFIQPKTRQNEMINNFLKPGLDDLCVSRTTFKWGIPVEFDPGHVVYVWIDALSNYITALGYLSDDDSDFRKFWPADVQLVGKEIVRFHTIIWPAMLMALDLPLPKQVYGHGWLVIDGGKMSKSKGNVVDPKPLVDKYGVDAIRYFLMREIAFGQDGSFTNEALLSRINSDLANDLGNLVSRTVGMIEKYYDSELTESRLLHMSATPYDSVLVDMARNTVSNVERAMDSMMFSDALVSIWQLVRRTNKYIDETEPWKLIKDEQSNNTLLNVMFHLVESIRITAVLIKPFMPSTSNEIFKQLGLGKEADNESTLRDWDTLSEWGYTKRGVKVCKSAAIFPRLDIKKELAELQNSAPENAAAQAKVEAATSAKPEISIDDFAKVELKVGVVIECEQLAGSDKLLKSKIKIGGEVRQVLSGIAKYYTPDEMVGKSVVVVTNLKPAKIRGEMSYGMILAAEDSEGRLVTVTVDAEIEDGARVS